MFLKTADAAREFSHAVFLPVIGIMLFAHGD
jgi:hypothetical protein